MFKKKLKAFALPLFIISAMAGMLFSGDIAFLLSKVLKAKTYEKFNIDKASASEVTVKLFTQDNGKNIVIKSGDVIQIELEVSGGTGYLWDFNKLSEAYFELLSKDTRVISKQGLTGGPVMMIWKLRAKQKGETDIELYLYRPWEGKDTAIDRFKIKAKIE